MENPTREKQHGPPVSLFDSIVPGATMSVHNTTLSLILLTRNDAAHLTDRVRACLAVLSDYARDLELIIVDDASDDATPARADYLASACDPVMVLHHARQRGYGRSLLSGLEVVRGDYVICLDSGSPLLASDMRRLLSFLDRYDLVAPAGSRRRNIWGWLSGLCMPGRDAPVLCAPTYRMLLGRTDLIRSLPVRAQSAWIYVELFALAQQRGAACVQVDVRAQESGLRAHMERYAQPPGATLRDLLSIRQSLRDVAAGSGGRRPVWQQKTTLGAVVALFAGGVWFFWRRRG